MDKRKVIRLKDYDYSENGVYFVTICSAGQKCIFSEIKYTHEVGANCVRPPDIILNDVGRVIYNEIEIWDSTYEFVSIDKFVIMPNRLHLLVSIERDLFGRT